MAKNRSKKNARKSTNSPPTTINDLPAGVLFHIFIRLSVEAAVICTSVCKTWYDMIKDPHFINSHLLYSKSLMSKYNGTNLVSFTKNLTNNYFLISDKISYQIKFRSHRFIDHLKFVGSVHGLVCMFNPRANHTIYLINPFIRKCRTLRYPAEVSRRLCQRMYIKHVPVVGFWYEQETDDYKIVWLPEQSGTTLHVYSFRSNYWKRVEVQPEFAWLVSSEDQSSVFLNQHLHWIATNSSRNECVILSFHAVEEVLGEIRMPVDISSDQVEHCYILLGVVNSSLCVLMLNHHNGQWELWVMENYGDANSWRLVRMDIMIPQNVETCLWITDYGQIVMRTDEGDILYYDTNTDEYEYADIQHGGSIQTISCMESLLLLDFNSGGGENPLI